MDWAIIWTILGVGISTIGIFITLFSWLRADIKEIEKSQIEQGKDLTIIKTLLLHKECCMIKDDRQIKKAE